MRVIIRYMVILIFALLLGACSSLRPPNLTGVNITEKTLLEVEEENLLEIEFYGQNEIHYAVAGSSPGKVIHTFINLETMETKQFDGMPSPSKNRYASIESDGADQTLCVYLTNDTVPYLEIKIPKRNDFQVLDYYWLSEDAIFIEGDRLWYVDLNTKSIEVIAESKTPYGENFFLMANEFPNVKYIGNNRNGFYYYEITGMNLGQLFFVPSDEECVLLNELKGSYRILFFDGKVFYWIGEWKCADNTKVFRIDVDNLYLNENSETSILGTTNKSGQLTLCISDCSSPETYQIPSDFLPGEYCYIDTTSVMRNGKYYNFKTGEGVDSTWKDSSVFDHYRKDSFSRINGKGFQSIDLVLNDEPYVFPDILAFSVKETIIEEVRG